MSYSSSSSRPIKSSSNSIKYNYPKTVWESEKDIFLGDQEAYHLQFFKRFY